jgi:adenylosuccinate lyase
MALTHGLVFSQAVLLALTASGLSREEAYRIVQRNAMRTWSGEGNFKQLLAADPEVTNVLTPEALGKCFDATRYLQHVDVIYERVFGS